MSFLIKENKVAVRICNETKMPLIEPLSNKRKEKESEEDIGKLVHKGFRYQSRTFGELRYLLRAEPDLEGRP